MAKFALIFKTAAIIALLLLVKLAVHYFNLDTISASPVITALIAGVIFTIAIIFTGTLSDFKESEKIPGELASSIKSLYRDSRVANLKNEALTPDMKAHIRSLLHTIVMNFKQNTWKPEGLLLFGATAFVLISLLLLIRDMDNPFEVGKNTSADVDLSILFQLEDYLKNK